MSTQASAAPAAAPAAKAAAAKPAPKVKTTKYTVDLSTAVKDGIIKTADYADFLRSTVKVEKKAGALGDKVTITNDANKVTIATTIPMSKRAIKYYTKKYLKKQQLRDYLRVIASSKLGYELRYFKMDAEDEGSEGDDE